MRSFTLRLALAGLAALVIAACSDDSPTSPSASSIQYSFSFDNVRGEGTVQGTIEGIITIDFLASALDSGTGSATQIEITSHPLTITPREGSVGPAPVPWTGTDLGFKRSAATVSSRS